MSYWATLPATGGKLQEALMRAMISSRKTPLALALLVALFLPAAPMPAPRAQSDRSGVKSILGGVKGDGGKGWGV